MAQHFSSLRRTLVEDRTTYWFWFGDTIIASAIASSENEARAQALHQFDLGILPDGMNPTEARNYLRRSVAKTYPLSGPVGVTEAEKRIDAYGIKGMGRTQWRRTFKNAEALNKWCEDNDAEVHGSREMDDNEQPYKQKDLIKESDDDEDGDPSEPEEDDITADDAGGPFFYQRKQIAANVKELKAWMKKEGYYPNVWWISDHGNAHLITDLHESAADLAPDVKRALCDRVEKGKASTVDFVDVMGLPFEAFLRYAQMSPDQMKVTAQTMRDHWGVTGTIRVIGEDRRLVEGLADRTPEAYFAKLLRNLTDLNDGRIEDVTFQRNNREIWDAIQTFGLKDRVQTLWREWQRNGAELPIVDE